MDDDSWWISPPVYAEPDSPFDSELERENYRKAARKIAERFRAAGVNRLVIDDIPGLHYIHEERGVIPNPVSSWGETWTISQYGYDKPYSVKRWLDQTWLLIREFEQVMKHQP